MTSYYCYNVKNHLQPIHVFLVSISNFISCHKYVAVICQQVFTPVIYCSNSRLSFPTISLIFFFDSAISDICLINIVLDFGFEPEIICVGRWVPYPPISTTWYTITDIIYIDVIFEACMDVWYASMGLHPEKRCRNHSESSE